MTSPGSQQRDKGPLGPLTHPVRRRILRYLHRCEEPRGAREVATALPEALTQISYHLRALASHGTTREAGVAAEGGALYESAVSDNPEVLALLKATQAEDGEEGCKAA
jgi:DNA-binding transcriptional ArsR family regulator